MMIPQPVYHTAHVLANKQRRFPPPLFPGLDRPPRDTDPVFRRPVGREVAHVLTKDIPTKVFNVMWRPRVLSHTPLSVSRNEERRVGRMEQSLETAYIEHVRLSRIALC